MKNYLITGATGYIGSKLTKRLVDEGHRVVCIVRKHSNTLLLESISSRIDLVIWDGSVDSLINGLKNYQIDLVFHLASCFIAEHNSNQVTELIESNVLFGTHLLEAMLQNNIKYIVNTGTSWQHYNNESYDPVCLYAATKEAFEKVIAYYINAHRFKCITLKLFDTYGPDDPRKKLLHLLKRIALSNEVLGMSPGLQQIDLTHIEDVVNAFLIAAARIIEKKQITSDESFAVASGKVLTLKDVVKKFELSKNVKLNINWGDRPYRDRETMCLWQDYSILPQWRPMYHFPEGIE
ncbi:NAD(P)-dependent oxidoreductase [Thiotrichales bacterium 19S3-7]|nr:NAD(P)-dependent oxidoreductase [Thiotrichales bacterium 19S3-7]MCF6800699.1 NAD(P)-dependent oxidoreductase [Thiotrichales bacterium 19S3-11]